MQARALRFSPSAIQESEAADDLPNRFAAGLRVVGVLDGVVSLGVRAVSRR